MHARGRAGAAVEVERVSARAYTVPTDAPEAGGTRGRDRTTPVPADATGRTGLGPIHDRGAGPVRGTPARAVRGVGASRPCAALAVPGLRHPERSHDRARVERTPADGVRGPRDGTTRLDPPRAGPGSKLGRADAETHLAG